MMYVVIYKTKPTFFLDGDVTGILTINGARVVAADILGIDDNDPALTVGKCEDEK